MSGCSRSLVAAGVGAVLLVVAGCGPGGLAGDASGDASEETSAAKPSGEVLAGVDPCGMLSEAELKSFGLKLPGESRSELPWSPGCYFEGDPVTARLEKNTRQTVNSSSEKETWAEFGNIQVNGRSAARAVPEGATQTDGCAVMFDAGQGLIQIQAVERGLQDDVDECAKALEIAEKVEPHVPEPA